MLSAKRAKRDIGVYKAMRAKKTLHSQKKNQDDGLKHISRKTLTKQQEFNNIVEGGARAEIENKADDIVNHKKKM